MTTYPIRLLAERNAEAGYHWFKPDTRRFFGSRVASYGFCSPDGARVYFVSSEYTGFSSQRPRAYSVRVGDLETGKVDTIGEFNGYATRAQAVAAAKRAARGDA